MYVCMHVFLRKYVENSIWKLSNDSATVDFKGF
jgi:hypothetical protein